MLPLTSNSRPLTAADKQEKGNLLISLGFDGKILLWKLQSSSQQTTTSGDIVRQTTYNLILVQIFAVFIQDLPKNLTPVSASSSSTRRRSISSGSRTNDEVSSEVGISCSALNPEDNKSFIVGCIGGAIFLCSLDTSKVITTDKKPITLLKNKSSSPIKVTYAAHRSNVQGLDFSVHSRGKVFISCDSQGEVRVYNVLETRPVSVIHVEEGLNCCLWSRVRESFIYCLRSDRHLISLSFFADEEDADQPGQDAKTCKKKDTKSSTHSEGRLRISSSFLTSLPSHDVQKLFLHHKTKPSSGEEIALVSTASDTTLYEIKS